MTYTKTEDTYMFKCKKYKVYKGGERGSKRYIRYNRAFTPISALRSRRMTMKGGTNTNESFIFIGNFEKDLLTTAVELNAHFKKINYHIDNDNLFETCANEKTAENCKQTKTNLTKLFTFSFFTGKRKRFIKPLLVFYNKWKNYNNRPKYFTTFHEYSALDLEENSSFLREIGDIFNKLKKYIINDAIPVKFDDNLYNFNVEEILKTLSIENLSDNDINNLYINLDYEQNPNNESFFKEKTPSSLLAKQLHLKYKSYIKKAVTHFINTKLIYIHTDDNEKTIMSKIINAYTESILLSKQHYYNSIFDMMATYINNNKDIYKDEIQDKIKQIILYKKGDQNLPEQIKEITKNNIYEYDNFILTKYERSNLYRNEEVQGVDLSWKKKQADGYNLNSTGNVPSLLNKYKSALTHRKITPGNVPVEYTTGNVLKKEKQNNLENIKVINEILDNFAKKNTGNITIKKIESHEEIDLNKKDETLLSTFHTAINENRKVTYTDFVNVINLLEFIKKIQFLHPNSNKIYIPYSEWRTFYENSTMGYGVDPLRNMYSYH